MNLRHLISSLALIGGLGVFMPQLGATPIEFSANGTNSLGNAISASAIFDFSTAGQFSITLSNTHTTTMHIGGADVLTGLYFNIGHSATLTTKSAYLGTGSVMLPVGSSTSGLESGWGYLKSPGLLNGVQSGSEAISASGLISGSYYNFDDKGPYSAGGLGGPAYGIVGSKKDYFSGVGLTPLEATTVVFRFTYTGTITGVSGVSFVYGTSSCEGLISSKTPKIVTVADTGSTALLLGLAFCGMYLVQRRRLQRQP